ncbi:MAG: LTA synthase family protein [Bryobacteraceae bacterium]|nr:LTA synthase family protein [Bryobacteraceae bacterium]
MKHRNLFACLTAGCLSFILFWYDQQGLNVPMLDYYRESAADRTYLYATLICSLLISAAYWIAWKAAVRSGRLVMRRVAQTAFTAVLIVSLELVRSFLNERQVNAGALFNAGALLTETGLAWGILQLWRGNPRIVIAARNVSAAMFLIFPVMGADFARRIFAGPSATAFEARTGGAVRAAAPSTRVVWLLFDEFDQRMAFEERPASLELPELDRLRAQSFSAAKAQRAGGTTDVAIPGLTTGQHVAAALGEGPDRLRLFTSKAPDGVDWRGSPHLFQQTRARGWNAAIAGWYHPYCRVFGDSLADCSSALHGEAILVLRKERMVAKSGLAAAIPLLFRMQWGMLSSRLRGAPAEDAWLAALGVQYHREQAAYLKLYRQVRERALPLISNPKLDFVYTHWPVPHPPGIWDRRRKEFSNSPDSDYLDNLDLVDRTVGEVRRELEARGLWESTVLIVTADHGYRPAEWAHMPGASPELRALAAKGESTTVPLIVKMPGAAQPFVENNPFPAILLKDLTLALLGGEIRDAGGVAKWIAARRAGAAELRSEHRR